MFIALRVGRQLRHGAPGGDAISLSVVVNAAPEVVITQPLEGQTSTTGTPLSFAGSASDAEDGDLTAGLSWSSDLDGVIGSGAGFVTSTLSEGTHVVTASVTDGHGMAGEAMVTTIRLPEPGAEGLLAGLLGLAALARRRRLARR